MTLAPDLAGRAERIGGALGVGGAAAVVVAGGDPTETAEWGIAIARAVPGGATVVDLLGDAPPIKALSTTDEDHHGIVDTFAYGVSVPRVSRPVHGSSIHVIPTGSESLDDHALAADARWQRVIDDAKRRGTVLVIVAPLAASGLSTLVTRTAGIVVVGDALPGDLDPNTVIALIQPPVRATVAPPVTPPPSRVVSAATRRISAAAFGGGVLATATLAAFIVWLAGRPMAWGPGKGDGRVQNTAQGGIESAGLGATRDTQPSADMAVANPEDSASASAFGVEMAAANTQAGAILKLQTEGVDLPSATFAPVRIGGALWYRMRCGAYATRAEADSLVAVLRERRRDPGVVVRLPYAFLVDSGVSASAVPALVGELIKQGLPVYALRQDDGTAWILLGAFESPAQSTLYAESMGSLGALATQRGTPTLVFRKGRAF